SVDLQYVPISLWIFVPSLTVNQAGLDHLFSSFEVPLNLSFFNELEVYITGDDEVKISFSPFNPGLHRGEAGEDERLKIFNNLCSKDVPVEQDPSGSSLFGGTEDNASTGSTSAPEGGSTNNPLAPEFSTSRKPRIELAWKIPPQTRTTVASIAQHYEQHLELPHIRGAVTLRQLRARSIQKVSKNYSLAYAVWPVGRRNQTRDVSRVINCVLTLEILIIVMFVTICLFIIQQPGIGPPVVSKTHSQPRPLIIQQPRIGPAPVVSMNHSQPRPLIIQQPRIGPAPVVSMTYSHPLRKPRQGPAEFFIPPQPAASPVAWMSPSSSSSSSRTPSRSPSGRYSPGRRPSYTSSRSASPTPIPVPHGEPEMMADAPHPAGLSGPTTSGRTTSRRTTSGRTTSRRTTSRRTTSGRTTSGRTVIPMTYSHPLRKPRQGPAEFFIPPQPAASPVAWMSPSSSSSSSRTPSRSPSGRYLPGRRPSYTSSRSASPTPIPVPHGEPEKMADAPNPAGPSGPTTSGRTVVPMTYADAEQEFEPRDNKSRYMMKNEKFDIKTYGRNCDTYSQTLIEQRQGILELIPAMNLFIYML
ncbi:hypothetical protein K435DRAFT_796433, partial [Dendrothele bispora CBS 962.96]